MNNTEQPNYYAIIPALVRYNANLRSSEKLLYGEITALCSKDGTCWASNDYFAKLYKVSKQAISLWVNNLKKNGFIEIDYSYKKNSKEILKRNIKLISLEVSTNGEEGINKSLIRYQQMAKENNTSSNNTSNKEIYKESFLKFWEAYPRKVQKSKAEEWFKKNKPSDELLKTIIDSVNKFKQTYDWKKDKGQFIPYPTSFLNQKRWEDEIEEIKSKPARRIL